MSIPEAFKAAFMSILNGARQTSRSLMDELGKPIPVKKLPRALVHNLTTKEFDQFISNMTRRDKLLRAAARGAVSLYFDVVAELRQLDICIWQVLESNHAYNHFLNDGLRSLGIHSVARTIIAHLIVFNLPLVSFGSGGGFIEEVINRDLNKYIPRKWVYAVDNGDPMNIWLPRHQKYRIPSELPYELSAQTMDDYARTYAQHVGNCALLLNWCFPDMETGDYDAIQIMRPKLIITIYECFIEGGILRDGCAGGARFHRWRKSQKNYKLVYTRNREMEIRQEMGLITKPVMFFNIWQRE